MPRLLKILSAVGLEAGRGSLSLWRVSGNNMFYAGVTLLFFLDPGALGFFVGLLAIVLFIPSSSDPMTSAPAARLDAWPLYGWERLALRALSPLLNPMSWLLLFALAWKHVAWGLWVMLTGVFVVGFLGSAHRMPVPWVPPAPGIGLAHLVRKDLRQFLTALDVYCALLIAVPAGVLRICGRLPAEARVPITGLMIIFLSTLALTLFGLEGRGGMTRYLMIPLPGWKILAAKGIAFLFLMLAVTAALSPVAGLSGGFLCLSVGHFVSVRQLTPQAPWRFRTSHAFGMALAQMVLSLLAAGLVTNFGAAWLLLCAAIYAASLWFCGKRVPPAC